MSYELPDCGLNKRDMLGKDGEEDAVYSILWRSKGGDFLMMEIITNTCWMLSWQKGLGMDVGRAKYKTLLAEGKSG
jgi:hypothetical protein